MNLKRFEEIKHDDLSVIYSKDGKFYFTMGDDMEVDDSDWFEEKEKEIEGMRCYMGYGDDIINCVEFSKLELIDEEMEDMLIGWSGDNCYSREE